MSGNRSDDLTQTEETGQSLTDYNQERAEQEEEEQKRRELYIPGILSDDSYKNNYFGIQFTPPGRWVLLSKEETAQNYGEAEMAALPPISNVAGMAVHSQGLASTETTLESVMDEIERSFASENLENFKRRSAGTTTEIGGKSFQLLSLSFTNQNNAHVIDDYYLLKKEKTVLIINVSYVESYSYLATEALQGFTPYSLGEEIADTAKGGVD